MKPIAWTRKVAFFFCPVCKLRVNDTVVTHDQCHDRTRGGCGEFVFTRDDMAQEQGHDKFCGSFPRL